MALVETLPAPPADIEVRRRALVDHLVASVAERWVALLALTTVLVSVGIVHAVNMANWPGFWNEDEGTYMARAWAVQTGLGAHHGPAPYTYWYDHPPFGWIQLVLWTWPVHSFSPGTVAVDSGREAMLIYALVSTAFVYVIAMRVGLTRPFALLATALFGLSPLSVEYLRSVFLDSIGLPWFLASFAFALSPKKRLSAYVASGACFAGAVLSKETFLILFPAVAWQVFQHADIRTRKMSLAAFSSVTLAVLLLYPLYAVLKGELLPGAHHVSLFNAIEFQLSSRQGSGSIFVGGSDANRKVVGWLDLDPWLIAGGAAALPVAFLVRRLRPITGGLAIMTLAVFRPGYLPAAFVTAALPLAALVLAGVASAAWNLEPALANRLRGRFTTFSRLLAKAQRRLWLTRGLTGKVVWRGVLVALGTLLAFEMVPAWVTGDHVAMTSNPTVAFRQAEDWVGAHVPRSATMLVDDDLWIDLVDDGRPPSDVIWYWELDGDPQVKARFPHGWRQMDYVVVTQVMRSSLLSASTTVPSLILALAHSRPVARFGSGSTWVSVMRVEPRRRTDAPWWLPGYGSLIPPKSGPQKGEQL